MEAWNVKRSSDLYNIANWGDGYFYINHLGNVGARPERNGAEVDLYQLLRSLVQRGIKPPVLVRFNGILRDRVRRFSQAFNSAIKECSCTGRYRGVYPIKVNQQRQVVEVIHQAGRDSLLGLEVGSKPELIATLAVHDVPEALFLCNGYKDDEYIELALLGRKLGKRVIIVVEQPSELNQILEFSERLGVEPEIGLRMKPSTPGSGHWKHDTGDSAKFGLSAAEIVEAIERLKALGKDHWLKLLHFHAGSQTPSIGSIKRRLKETARMYVEIAGLCPSLCMFDAGGGLAVDYDGSRTTSDSSMNYTVEEYARDVVYALTEACNAAGVKHPDFVTESGRALTAHHAVLITEVMDVAWTPLADSAEVSPPASQHEILGRIYQMYCDVSVKNCHETLNDALAIKDEVLERFNQGDLTLLERAYADRTIWLLMERIKKLAANLRYVPEDLQKINDELRDLYFCNFSMFQSTPDIWAVDQILPIMPIHRLTEEPTREASIADVSCDSEGHIDRFMGPREAQSYVRLHPLKKGEPYYLGVFLVGAYQEVLGDLYNLLGDTHAVHIDLVPNDDHSYRAEITSLVEGDSVIEVISYLEYDLPELVEKLRISTERNVREGNITHDQGAKLAKRFKEAINSYTYPQPQGR